MSSVINIKTPDEIEKMRKAGKLAADVLEMIEPYIKPGISTDELNTLCHRYIVDVQKAIPAPLNYKGFPKSICTSINQQVCHGIPGPRILKSGDLLNIDVTVIKDDYHGDTSKTFLIGKPSILAQRLTRIAQECLYKGISVVKPGAYLGDIASVIQTHAEFNRFSIVREYCGHGIGRKFHEPLQVLHFGKAGAGIQLVPGMTFTIEPMVNAGERYIKHLADHWTVVTKDHSLSAQFEHTILVTKTGYEILTLRKEENDFNLDSL